MPEPLIPRERARLSAGAALIEAAFDGLDTETVGRATSRGLFLPSPLADLKILFDRLDLAAYGSVADLGSGDGRVVLLASLYTRAWGLEVDGGLVAAARARALSLGLDRAAFATGDFLEMDLSPFELLYIYPDKPLDKLARKLAQGFSGRVLVYGPGFPVAGFKEEAVFQLPVNRARLLRPEI